MKTKLNALRYLRRSLVSNFERGSVRTWGGGCLAVALGVQLFSCGYGMWEFFILAVNLE